MFFQKDIETMPRDKLESLQLERLKRIVDYCANNVPFYSKRLKEAGITGDKIKTLSDIQYIPLTTKEDIRDSYPFGLFAKPLKDMVRIHASSGTTGKPTVVGYTKNDLEMWSDCVARITTAVGASSDDIIQISFGYGLFTGALGLHYGLEKVGATVVPNSSGNTEKTLMFMRDFKTTGLVSTPSYALYMSEVAKDLEYPMSDYNLKLGLFGSEGYTPEMRDQIEANWGLFATDNYGMSEILGPGVSGECHLRTGLHFCEDNFLPEIIDQKTCQVKDRGEEGELVITTLTKEGIPLLRYRTKDITSLNYEQCECGRTGVRMEKIKGRSDDMLKIRGVNVFPSQIESVIMTIPEIGPHYQLIVRRSGYQDSLEVKVELIDGSLLERYTELEKLQNKIIHKLNVTLGLQCKVNLSEPKSIQRFVGKAQRIVDLRTLKEEKK